MSMLKTTKDGLNVLVVQWFVYQKLFVCLYLCGSGKFQLRRASLVPNVLKTIDKSVEKPRYLLLLIIRQMRSRMFETGLRPVLYVEFRSRRMQFLINKVYHLIIYCLNCIRRYQNSTFETGLRFLQQAVV